jgi:8-oxo-dGTP diphosphatase
MFEGDSVALIRKNRPEWQAGLLNGIGGHVEANETPTAAMVREFEEETGYYVSPFRWFRVAILSGSNYEVHFFTTTGPVRKLKSTTDEEVVVYRSDLVTSDIAIPNLTWLLPLAKLVLKGQSPALLVQEFGS